MWRVTSFFIMMIGAIDDFFIILFCVLFQGVCGIIEEGSRYDFEGIFGLFVADKDGTVFGIAVYFQALDGVSLAVIEVFIG